jgi:hypothetical protein
MNPMDAGASPRPALQPAQLDAVAQHSEADVDAGRLVVSFTNNTNKTIMSTFSGKLDRLEAAAGRLAGCAFTDAPGFDLVLKFQALPHIPMYLQCNDAAPPSRPSAACC